MTYFLINNDFHYEDLKLHMNNIHVDISLIQIPHRLNPVSSPKFKEIHTFWKCSLDWKDFTKIKTRKFEIKTSLNIKSTDILYVYSEYDLCNQYVISLFYEENASVYLLEDGMTTLVTFSKKRLKPAFSWQIKEFILKYFYGFKYTNIISNGNAVVFIMKDDYFKGAFVYWNVGKGRNIPVTLIQNPYKKTGNFEKENSVIFLHQHTLYDESKFDVYLSEMNALFKIFNKNFKNVYFKFHPYTDQDTVEKIKKNLNKEIIYIDEKDPIEILVKKYKLRYATSYFSSALKNLYFLGVEPIFLYHLSGVLKIDNVLLTTFLEMQSYNFVDDIQDINAKYSSNIQLTNPVDFPSIVNGNENMAFVDIQ